MQANSFAVIDLETTGFGYTDRIIEIGVVLLDQDGNEEGRWETLIQPHRDIPNTFIHGITATDLVHAPTFASVAKDLAEVLNGRTMVAHGASFEYRFLNNEFQRVGLSFPEYGGWTLDTAMLAPKLLPGRPKSLKLALAVAGIVNKQPHRAITDAEATAELLRYLLPKIDTLPVNRGAFQLDTAQAAAMDWQPVVRGDVSVATNWVGKIARKLGTTGDGALNKYRAALQAALADREITDTELAHLQQQAEELELGEQDVADIHDEFIRQLAVEAWLDGVVTAEEKAVLEAAAQRLCVDAGTVAALLAAPVSGTALQEFQLRPGDRIALTGQMELPRDQWEARICAAGMSVGGVSKRCVLLVAANPDTQSGKAKLARQYNIPVINEVTFARLLGAAVDQADNEGLASARFGSFAEVDGFDDSIYYAGGDQSAVGENFATRFPWLAHVDAAPGTAEAVAAAWISQFAGKMLAELSPTLTATQKPELIGGSALIYSRLLGRFEHPLMATVHDLQDINGVGHKRLHDLVVGVVLMALDAQEQQVAPDAEAAQENQAGAQEQVSAEDTARAAEEAARAAAELLAQGEQSLRDSALPTDAGNQLLAQLGDQLDAMFAAGDARYGDIFVGRLVQGKTLDELGQSLNVTRERVRQLEKQMRETIAEQVPLQTTVEAALAERCRPMTAIMQVRRDFPQLGREVVGVGITVGQLLSSLSTKWELSDEWVIEPDLDQRIKTVCQELADPYGVVEAAAVAGELGISVGDLKQRIETGQGYRYLIIDEQILTMANSHNDRAVAVLSMHGQPLPVDELAALTGTDQTRSLGNALAQDVRTHKVTAKKWALADWGLEEFVAIADWIGKQVDDAGEVPLAQLLAQCSRLEVAENSMRAYASSGEFVVESGMVTRGSGDVIISDPIEEAKAVYLRDGQWHLLVEANRGHLRGSGFPVPRAIAGMYAVPFMGAVTLTSRLGDQEVRFNRNQQVSTSTIRRFLLDLDSQEGDRVWLKFGDDRTFDVTPATPLNPNALGMAFVLNQMGLDDREYADDAAAMAAVNEATGLDAGIARRRTVSRLRYRYQDALADAIVGLQ